MKRLQVKPKRNSKTLMSITHSKAKMFEYNVPIEYHLKLEDNKPDELFSLTIGMLGDFCQNIINDTNDQILEKQEDLKFVSDFFDTYIKTKLNKDLDYYLLLIGSATFYLSNQQGSSSVLIKEITIHDLDLNSEHLEKLIFWILKSDYENLIDIESSIYKDEIENVSSLFKVFFDTGILNNLFEVLNNFRKKVYEIGSYREILFIDVIYALVKSKYKNATWINLPKYTDLNVEKWQQTILKPTFIKEFWPSQHLLGENEVFKGKSAVIQLPTSAGKTKSTELIIRSAFLSERANIAIIVAPFKALCNEIQNDLSYAFENEDIKVNEFTDVLQKDINIDEFIEENEKNIFISTPEKLYYLLKQSPELSDKIGLLIYDEGHQFDSGTRGVIYELLVTSLKKVINIDIQVVLISAVISNATNINDWLNSGNGTVVSGNFINTNRTIAFASWKTSLGQLKFINKNDIDKDLYFVPRVLSQHELALLGRESKTRFFPEKNNNGQVATYLAFNLINNGSVAVFVPRQISINTLCSDINEAYRRELTLEKPIRSSNSEEMIKLHYLYCKHLGEDNEQTKAVHLGVTTHHGNLPDSIKLSVEHALQNSYAKVVFCTSTLAQGVNLPIKYLIVTGVYQGKEQIKVRDFHNLIGRSGRAGKYTEGSIIFADIDIYDKKANREQNWRWNNARKLLDSNNSEKIESNILDIFSSIQIDDNKSIAFDNVEHLMLLLNSDIEEIYVQFDNADVIYEFIKKRNFLLSIENFIIENFDDVTISLDELVRLTLAYHLADETKKELLIELFIEIKSNIEVKIPEDYKRKIYSKTLFGIYENKAINDWLDDNIIELINTDNLEQLEDRIWYFLKSKIRNKSFRNFNKPQYLNNIYNNWLNNKSYDFIYAELADLDIKMGNTARARKLTVDYISEICEKALSFEGTLILSSVIAFLDLYNDEHNITNLVTNLTIFQKKLKYGLNSINAISIYEMGFIDKFIALELSQLMDGEVVNYKEIKVFLKTNSEEVENILSKYPSYFMKIYRNLK